MLLQPLHDLGPWAPPVAVAVLACTVAGGLARFYRPRRLLAAQQRLRTAEQLRREMLKRADSTKAARLARIMDTTEFRAARSAYRLERLRADLPTRVLPCALGFAAIVRSYPAERLADLFGRVHAAALPLPWGGAWGVSAPLLYVLTVLLIWAAAALLRRSRAAAP